MIEPFEHNQQQVTTTSPSSQNRLPYVGPRPFERGDRDLFFGREREANDLLSLIVAHRVLVLYAQSGAGKTSLLNARLIPLLEQEGFEVFPPARVQGLIPPGVDPREILNLYTFNTQVSLGGRIDQPRELAQSSIATFLTGRPHPPDEDGLPAPRVVIFDQFEELFAVYQDRWRDRTGFFEQVGEALEADPLLRVVLVMREDYIARLDPYAALLPGRLRTRMRLERLREDAALQAVIGPLRGTGRSFAEGVAQAVVAELMKIKVEIDPGKVELVPGEFVEPVQLQVVCQSLWRELPEQVHVITRQHLERYAHIERVLARFYDEAVGEAAQASGVEEGELRDWCEKTLITSMGTRGTVYRTHKMTGGIPNAAMDVLERKYLIRAEWRAGTRWYELSHDQLIEPVRESNRLWTVRNERSWIASIRIEPVRESNRLSTGPQQGTTETTGMSSARAAAERNRRAMLEKVRALWIQGVLENTLQDVEPIERRLEERPDAIAPTADGSRQELDRPPATLPAGTPIIDVFDQRGGALLILGAPGSGRTTLLLELEQALITRAESDPAYPIPVVFSLASSVRQHKRLDDWLVEELYRRYEVPRSVGNAWIVKEQILPLLDGLDEVEAEYRDSCARKINTFRQKHVLVPIAVSCRSSDYEALSEKLKFQGAVAILPLTAQQIDAHLERAGMELATLREALRHDEALRSLAQTPLMIKIMMRTYQDMPSESISAGSIEEPRQRIFEAMIQGMVESHRASAAQIVPSGRYPRWSVYGMLKRRQPSMAYTPGQIKRWLSWLARQMQQRDQSVFYIERLQPDWLPTPRQRRVVIWGTVLISALLGHVLGWVWISLTSPVYSQQNIALNFFNYILFFIPMLYFGLLGAWAGYSRAISCAETIFWSSGGLRTGFPRALVIGLGSAFVSGLIFGIIVVLGYLPRPNIPDVLGVLSLLGLLAVFGLLGGLALALLSGVSQGETKTKSFPNQGIRLSRRNARRGALIGVLIAALVFGIPIGLVSALTGSGPSGGVAGVVFSGFFLGPYFAVVAWLRLGGRAALQHMILRLLLWSNGSAPWNYARFLDHAARHLVVQRVGGGYMLAHPALLDYFANLEGAQQGE
jgi:hypothetical protein